MKNLLAAVVFGISIFGFSGTSFSQTKIAHISTEELIGDMPEAEKANAQLQDYQTSLQQQGAEYYKELNEKDSIFQKDSARLSPAAKELRRNDLIALYQKVQGWNQTMQQMVQQKSQELIVPIRSKAYEAIKAVAKENGYVYVLEGTSVLVGPDNDDILELVKKKLGIKAAAPVAAPAKPKQ